VLAGPNGNGKSSLFDAFTFCAELLWRRSLIFQDDYRLKVGAGSPDPMTAVEVAFAEGPPDPNDAGKLFYFRSAYRNDAEFRTTEVRQLGPILGGDPHLRMIDNDVRVSQNYQRLAAESFDALFSGEEDDRTVRELRERLIGVVRDALKRLFPDLVLVGPGAPLQGGTFLFEKSGQGVFPYMNLSGGEKAALDLILDVVVKRSTYDDTIWCIDEPEAHLNTAVQAPLLEVLLDLLPPRCQLWVGTHSVGMLRVAREMQQRDRQSVALLDFGDANFDEPVTLRPATVDRGFIDRALRVALGDLADLVAPERVVLCEGRPLDSSQPPRAEFDRRCFRAIFNQTHPETDFLSVGNAYDVESDRLGVGRAIQALVPGTRVTRVIDRDRRTDQEVQEEEVRGGSCPSAEAPGELSTGR